MTAGTDSSTGYPVIQVIVLSSLQGPLREWLSSRSLYLYQIPVQNDLPTYGIGLAETGALPREPG
jgi:hypothetical protein